MKINSMPEMAPTDHREGLCYFSIVRTTSADVAREAMLSYPLSLPSLTAQGVKVSPSEDQRAPDTPHPIFFAFLYLKPDSRIFLILFFCFEL